VQLTLFGSRTRNGLSRSQRAAFSLSRTEHGGTLREGRRKIERPVSTRQPMHLVLHSDRAHGEWSMLRHRRVIREALGSCKRRNDVKIHGFVNVGSHLHLLVQTRKRERFQAFLRSFAGIVARVVTGARKSRPLAGGRFWSTLAWSRVVTWGRDYAGVRHYLFRNLIEASDGKAIRHALERGPKRDANERHTSHARAP
jgi:REP element-mobilizing transposase RayT